MKLVQVKWVDSHSFDGWATLEQLKEYHIVSTCISIGWLLNDEKDSITLVPHINFDKEGETINQCSGDMTIPRVAVTEIKELPHRFALRK